MAFKRSAVRSRLAPPMRSYSYFLYIISSYSFLFQFLVMKNRYFILCSLVCLTGCSWFSFSTNVDPENFTEYYKSSLVKQYHKEDLQTLENYEDLGPVEGISCQAAPEEAEPKEKLAMKYMLESAYDIGANAVVTGKCIELEATLHCIKEYTCYGQALKVK